MVSILVGLAAGVGLPVQTSVNARLRKQAGSPFRASFISFTVSLLFLLILLFITEGGLSLPWDRMFQEPFWIWGGGVCGVIFLTGNIMIFPKLGSVQTVVLPVMGQVLMGLVIDHFGWFCSDQTSLTALRAAGAVLVVTGVFIVPPAKSGGEASPSKQEAKTPGRFVWQALGVLIGMMISVQTAINGRVGQVMESPVRASVISFLVGVGLLFTACMIQLATQKGIEHRMVLKGPWWMWTGGVLGALYNLANVFLSHRIGTGMCVIILLVGSTTGGLLIDQAGLFEVRQQSITLRKVAGVAVMILGAVLIRLL